MYVCMFIYILASTYMYVCIIYVFVYAGKTLSNQRLTIIA